MIEGMICSCLALQVSIHFCLVYIYNLLKGQKNQIKCCTNYNLTSAISECFAGSDYYIDSETKKCTQCPQGYEQSTEDMYKCEGLFEI